MTAQAWIAGVIGIAAIVDDLARRQISNWIPCSAFAAGLILSSACYPERDSYVGRKSARYRRMPDNAGFPLPVNADG